MANIYKQEVINFLIVSIKYKSRDGLKSNGAGVL